MNEEKAAKARARLGKAVSAFIKASGYQVLGVTIGSVVKGDAIPSITEYSQHTLTVNFVGKEAGK